jgi:AcrR family transcriptional regulator
MAAITIRKTDKKERIIAAAIKLWRQAHRVNKVSLVDIAAEAGVSPTTVYNNFSTRQGLVYEVIRYIFSETINRQKAILKSDLPFSGKIQSVISAKMEPIEGIELDLLDKICTDTAARQYVAELTESEFEPMIKAIIQEGKLEGYIRREIPDEIIMLFFDVLRTGEMAYNEEISRIITDKDATLAFTRLVYFGLFQKEFDVNFKDSGRVINTDR